MAGQGEPAAAVASFHVDVSKIQTTESSDQQAELEELGIRAFNQQDFEEGVAAQVDQVLRRKEEVRAGSLLNKELKSLLLNLRPKEQRLNLVRKQAYSHPASTQLKGTIDQLSAEIRALNERKEWLGKTLAGPASALPEALLEEPGKRSSGLLDLDQSSLVETGELTPFEILAQKKSLDVKQTSFEKYLTDQSKKTISSKKVKREKDDVFGGPSKLEALLTKKAKLGMCAKKEGKNFFDGMSKVKNSPHPEFASRNVATKLKHNFSEDCALSDVEIGDEVDEEELLQEAKSEDEWRPEEEEEEDRVRSPRKKMKRAMSSDDEDVERRKGKKKESSEGRKKGRDAASDDGSHKAYLKRLVQHEKQKALDEWSDSGSDMEMDGGFKVPGRIWNKLYRYQKTGVRWMWELHCQKAGGILGDEMGLGKTIQVIAFLAGLDHSQLTLGGESRGLGPSLVICPTTVLHQWVMEFHKWWPQHRVAVLHHSGSYTGSEVNLIRSVIGAKGILVTAYSSVLVHQDLLLPQSWHYAILDEGHKIRNPNAQITVACKQLKTCHRIILSGSPVQNNLKELWSLFDFIFPGKLGTLPDFMQHFSVPIVQGGYSNATQVAVQTAYKCACVLRDTINPYLLRRMKADVKDSLALPAKNEQVLFCRLTDNQREVYKEYLDSKECNMILSGSFMVFPGLVTLRKVCNHPDLSTGGPSLFHVDEDENEEARKFGFWKRSGKMQVLDPLLRLWRKQGHRVLLFSQSRQMLGILQSHVVERGYTFRRMDGTTPISARQPLINSFNQDPSIFLFLLTTRVGGLGINLTGANRVVIYDPDWNPSTDLQARERAWRIGQTKDVTVYRLLIAGSIEEKIYHRQIFKQFLTNRVLKDPKQRRFFKANDLHELFTLNDDDPKTQTETSALFAGTGSSVKVKVKKNKKKTKNRFDLINERKEKNDKSDKSDKNGDESGSEDEKLTWMKEMAKRLSQQMTKVVADKNTGNGSDEAPKKKRKKRTRKDAKFEGERVKGLVKQSAFEAPAAVSDDGEKESSEQQDDYVLRKLLKKTGVHSVLHHDRIMQSSKADYALVEMEADRVAKEAVRALKSSRSLCQQAGGAARGVATWTGQVGTGGAPNKPRFGKKKKIAAAVPKQIEGEDGEQHFNGSSLLSRSSSNVLSSTDLLKRMQQRNLNPKELYREGSDDDESGGLFAMDAQSLELQDPKTLDLLTDLRNFLALKSVTSGGAGTDELLDEFGDRVGSEQSAVFKAMLKEVAVLHRGSTVQKIWKLKPVFR